MKLYARAGATAIAAVLALSSTQIGAQEAPAATQPVPTVAPPPPTTTDTTPATTADTTPATSVPDATAAPAAQPKHKVTRTRTTTTKARTAATAPIHTVSRSVATHTVHATNTPVATPAPAPAPAAAPPASQSAVTPVVDVSARPAPAPATAPARTRPDNTAIELGAGALALLAIGGGAWALSRRRRRDEEVVDEVYEPERIAEPQIVEPAATVHHEQPAMVAPSAFAWGNQPPAAEKAEDDGSDRRPGESWVERAYRGPSPANPSVSLRARLKRAAFFDKREREVAAGTAEPVETDAGLPEAMVDEQERELA